jgi:protease IV
VHFFLLFACLYQPIERPLRKKYLKCEYLSKKDHFLVNLRYTTSGTRFTFLYMRGTMATFADYMRNIFWLLLLLQLGPILFKSIKTQYSDLLEAKTKVGVVTIKGVLYEAEARVRELKKLFEEKDIKAIVLKIECPGGSAGTAQTIFNEIKNFKSLYTHKYVVALIENIAASGGYYIATAADYIIASPGAFIGSIGAYIQHPYFKDFIEYHKIKYEIIKSGEYKGMGNPFLELTPEQHKLLQGVTENVHQQFIRDVAAQRPGLPDAKQWGQAQIFTGEQALALKLIDAVGSPSTAIKVLRENAHIEGKIEWVRPSQKTGFLATLLSGESDDDKSSYLSSFISTVCQVVEERYIRNPVKI